MPTASRAAAVPGAVVGGLLTSAAVAVAIGGYAWRRGTVQRLDSLASHLSRAGEGSELLANKTRLSDLPAPVARYLAFALPNGQRLIRAARLGWAGDMRLRPNAGWSPFTAEQRFTASPPGFVWDAAVRMALLLPVRVRDSYVAGDGEMLGRLAGLTTVVRAGGTREMAEGALWRFRWSRPEGHRWPSSR